MTDASDQAWKIHAAQVDWTGKVDAKASFAFGIESASLGVAVALSANGRLFAGLSSSAQQVAYWMAISALLVGVACSLLAVIPRLRGRTETMREAASNYIYFGHLRHWDPADLAETLGKGGLLDVLARQCVNMAKIAWRKHRLVQASMISGSIGIASLVACGVLVTN